MVKCLIFFSKDKVQTLEDAINTDDKLYEIYFTTMLENGIIAPPSKYEAHFISLAHKSEDIEKILETVEKAFKNMK